MQSRLTQVLDEQSSTGQALLEIYSSLGIDVFDKQTGQIRSFFDIMVDLNEKWGDLSTNEQEYIALTQAGANQTQNFMALMSNFDTVLKATDTAYESTGSAMRENSKYMEGLEASTQHLKAEFQDLANNVINNQLVKSLMELGTKVLKLLNTNLGKIIVQFTLLTSIGWGATSLAKALGVFGVAGTQISNFVKILKNLPGIMMTAKYAGMSLGKSIEFVTGVTASFSSVALPVIGILAAITLGITALVKSYKESHLSLEETQKEVQSLNDKLEQNAKRLQEIEDMPWPDKTADIYKEKDAIEAENDELERQRQLLLANNLQEYKKAFEGEQKALVSGVRLDTTGVGTVEEAKELQFAAEVFADSFTSAEAAAEAIVGYLYQGFTPTEEYTALDFLLEKGVEFKEAWVAVDVTSEEAFKNMKLGADNLLTDLEKTKETTGEVSEATEIYKDTFLKTYKAAYDNAKNIIAVEGEQADETVKQFVEIYESVVNAYDGYTQEVVSDMQAEEQEVEILEGEYNELRNKIDETQRAASQFNRVDYLKGFADSVKKASKDVKSFKGISADAFKELLNYLPDLTNSALTAQLNISGLSGALFDSQGNLTATGQAAINAAGGFEQLASAAIMAQKAVLQSQLIMAQQERQGFLGVTETSPGEFHNIVGQAQIKQQAGEKLTAQEYQALNAWNKNYLEITNITNRIDQLDELAGSIADIGIDNLFGDGPPGGGGAGSKGPTDAAMEAFDLLYETLQHDRDMDVIGEEEYYDRLEQLVKNYVDDATAHMEEYGLTTDQINRNIYKYEEEIYKGRKQLAEKLKEDYEKLLREEERKYKEAVKKQKEEWEKARREEKEALEKRKEAFEAAFGYISDQANKEIEALENQREEVEKYWDDKINALNESNDALERQIELEKLEENLAKARQKRVLVFKDGRYQYIEDVDAVSQAKQELEDFNREDALRKEAESLEKSKEEALKALDDQIKGWQKYLDEISDAIDKYEKEQDRLLAEQILGTKLEGDAWKDRLDNLQQYVDEYLDILGQISKVEEQMKNPPVPEPFVPPPKPDGLEDYGDGDYPVPNKKLPVSREDRELIDRYKQEAVAAQKRGDYSAFGIAHDAAEAVRAEYGYSGGGAGDLFLPLAKYKKYFLENGHEGAYKSGTLGAKGGMSLVGESGAELRVLNHGDGILPADVTRNLWQWGMTSPGSMIQNLSNMKNNSQFSTIEIQNLNLPEVKDGQGFVDFMRRNFYTRAVQFAVGN